MSEQTTTEVAGSRPDTTQTHEVAQFLRRFHVALVVLEGDGAGENILVTRLPFVIGRGKKATMRISNETVSRRHARLCLSADNRLELIDGGSVNGTFVNAERIEAALLEDGDQIRFGSVRYQLVIEERGPMTYIAD
jgi:pSer/pThr/pTyr-binding forkhead associated (FHA) protein